MVLCSFASERGGERQGEGKDRIPVPTSWFSAVTFPPPERTLELQLSLSWYASLGSHKD